MVEDVRELVELAEKNGVIQYMYNNPIEDPELLQTTIAVKNKKSIGSKGKSKGDKKASKGNKSVGSKGDKRHSKGSKGNKSVGSRGGKQRSKGSKGNKSVGSKGNKRRSKGSKGSKGKKGTFDRAALVAEIQEKVKEFVEKQKPGE